MSADDDCSIPSKCNICDETAVLATCASCDTSKCTAIICSRCTHEIMRHKADTYLSAPSCPFCSVGFLSIEGIDEALALENQLIMDAARYVGLKDPKGDNDYRRMIDKFKLMGYAGNMSQLTKQQDQASTSQLRLEVARLSALFADSKQLPPGPLEKILFIRKRKHSSVIAAAAAQGEDNEDSYEEPHYFQCPSSPLRDSSCSSSSTSRKRKKKKVVVMRNDNTIDMDGLLLQRLDGLSNQLQSQSQCMNDAAVVQRDLIAKVGAIESSQLQLQLKLGHRMEEVKPERRKGHHLHDAADDTMMALMHKMHQQLMDLSSQVAVIKDSISLQTASHGSSSSHHHEVVVVSPMSLPLHSSDHSMQMQPMQMGGPSSSGSSSGRKSCSIHPDDDDEDDDLMMMDSWKKEVVAELKSTLMMDFQQALTSAVQHMRCPLAPPPPPHREIACGGSIEEEEEEEDFSSRCGVLEESLTSSSSSSSDLCAGESSLVGVPLPSPDAICPVCLLVTSSHRLYAQKG